MNSGYPKLTFSKYLAEDLGRQDRTFIRQAITRNDVFRVVVLYLFVLIYEQIKKEILVYIVYKKKSKTIGTVWGQYFYGGKVCEGSIFQLFSGPTEFIDGRRVMPY